MAKLRPKTPDSLIHGPNAKLVHILNYLEHHLPAYPFEHDLDARFVEELLCDFTCLDVLEEIKRFRWYYDDAPFTGPNRPKKPRLELRRWLVEADIPF